MPLRLPILGLFVLILGSGIRTAHADDAKPWRLRDAAGLPPWLDVGLAHRSRIESLRNDYRATSDGDETAYVMRTLLSIRGAFEPFFVALEGQDSRAYASDGAPLGTTNVNALELLQAHAGLMKQGLFAEGDEFEAKLGRITMDVGSRRLVARNRYRNTINGFMGLDVQWTSPEVGLLRTFAVLPVTRLPSDADAIADNEIKLDEENTDSLFWGAFFARGVLGIELELYTLGLHERDGEVATSNRQLLTPGLRLYRVAEVSHFDFEVEGAGQVGASRASSAADDSDDLDHRAFFGHVEAGYTADLAWAPRTIAQFDYASGDRNPDDGTNGRFDTLFGARRFEWGPTGIYGPFARSNLMTPGLRLELNPHPEVDAFVAYRGYWLASKRDAWTTAGLRDPAGASGRFLGQQPEVRVRWHVLPKNLDLDVGAAHLIRGGFAESAPDGREGSSTYLYTQVTGTI